MTGVAPSIHLNITALTAGAYELCYLTPSAPPRFITRVTVRDIRLAAPASPARATTSVPLTLSGAPDGAAVAVVPWSGTGGCAASGPTASVTGAVAGGEATVDLQPLGCGWHRVCYREPATASYEDGLELALELVPYPDPRFFPSQVPAGSPQFLVVRGQGLDLLRDGLEVVPQAAACGDPNATAAALAPTTARSAAVAQATVALPAPGTYRVCYRRAGTGQAWAELEPALEAYTGVTGFSGMEPPGLQMGTQTLTFQTVARSHAHASKVRRMAPLDDGQVAVARGVDAAQGPDGGCVAANFVADPTALSSSGVTVPLDAPGVYVLCYRGSAEPRFVPIGVFPVANESCEAIGGPYPRQSPLPPACEVCCASCPQGTVTGPCSQCLSRQR